jgi:hypothetical protein
MTARETIPGMLVDELTDADADEAIRKSWPHVWPACCGNCSEGRTICPTPEACQMGVDDEAYRSTEAMGYLLIYAVAAVAALALLVMVTK